MAIQPSNFVAPVEQALIAELNKKYSNRVLHDVGLCICVFDLSQVGEGKVRYGDGCLWYKGSCQVRVQATYRREYLFFIQ
jgi:DNA-directed RNA polymerase III subunit RPC8